jgi:hypothetical protein
MADVNIEHNGVARCGSCGEPSVPVLIGDPREVEQDPHIIIRCLACAAGEAADAITSEAAYVLWPGSDAARAAGCACPVLDNGHGSVELARDRGGWSQRSDCPVHGPQPAPIPLQEVADV